MSKGQRVADFLLSPGPGWRGVLTLQALSIAGGLLTTIIGLVKPDSVLWPGLSFLLTLLLLVILVLTRQRSKPRVIPPGVKQPSKHAGLIVLIGPGRPGEDPMKQSAWQAIEYHLAAGSGIGLRKCWLITPHGNDSAAEVAGRILAKCQASNVEGQIVFVKDPFDVQETYDAVKRIYEVEAPKNGLDGWQLIGDFTGATKPMSAGVVLACGQDRPMQYMYGRADGVASVPREITFALQA